MVARFSAASLGLLAFAISATAGLLVGNPVDVTLSRSIFALVVFSVLGVLLGGAAQLVVSEHERGEAIRIREKYRGDLAVKDDGEMANTSLEGETQTDGT